MKKQNWEKESFDLSEIVKELRIRNGLSQQQLAELVKVEKEFIQRIEDGTFISNLLAKEKENWLEELEARQIKE